MLNVQIICVGKLKESFYRDAVAEYVKRLGAYCRLELLELPEERLPKSPSRAQIDAALAKEGDLIRARLSPSARVVALCIEGRLFSSEDLSELISEAGMRSEKRLIFLIGGSCGLDKSLKAQAHVCLSMSPMTFPHHLARVMLLEQIYRAFKIREGSDYHK